jgi:ribonucleotide reductase alpha subunit
MPEPEHKKMTAMHFYGWEKGLKTGQYYFRSRPARDAIKFTVNMEMLLQAADHKDPNEILKALEKAQSKEETSKTVKPSINLGRKQTEPVGGFTGSDPALKRQKV